MSITFLDCRTLAVAFAYHAATVAKVKGIAGAQWDKERKRWLVPAAQVLALAAALPMASWDYDALGVLAEAETAGVRRFADSLRRLGVCLALGADGRVVASGLAVTDLLQGEVDKRAAGLRRVVEHG